MQSKKQKVRESSYSYPFPFSYFLYPTHPNRKCSRLISTSTLFIYIVFSKNISLFTLSWAFFTFIKHRNIPSNNSSTKNRVSLIFLLSKKNNLVHGPVVYYILFTSSPVYKIVPSHFHNSAVLQFPF